MSIQDVAKAETYEEVEKLIRQICWEYFLKFGGDFDEYLSVGNEAYLRSFEKHDPQYGEFTTFLGTCVRNAILDLLRKRTRLKVTRLIYDTDRLKNVESDSDFSVLVRGLSEDASKIIELIYDCPGDLSILFDLKKKKDKINTLRAYLSRLGWGKFRITEAFGEVRQFVN